MESPIVLLHTIDLVCINNDDTSSDWTYLGFVNHVDLMWAPSQIQIKVCVSWYRGS